MVATLSEMTKLWDKALKKIKQEIDSSITFDNYIDGSYIYDIEGDTVTIVAKNKVGKVLIEGKYNEFITRILNELEDIEFEIKAITSEEVDKIREETKRAGVTVTKEEAPEETKLFADAKINPDLTFNSFVVGEFNKDAHKAAMFVARNGGTMFNPLFIYSHSGLGKTHLLHAIGNEIRDTRLPNAKILYINANDFVEEYIKYVKAEKDLQSFKDSVKDVDILLFDDVQFLAEKVKTEEMFFYIYQYLINKGKRIIITSDRQPNELKGLEDRLITRFTQGLTVRINEPDIETCVEILKQKITNSGMDINGI